MLKREMPQTKRRRASKVTTFAAEYGPSKSFDIRQATLHAVSTGDWSEVEEISDDFLRVMTPKSFVFLV